MNKRLACVEYEDLTADQERETFQGMLYALRFTQLPN